MSFPLGNLYSSGEIRSTKQHSKWLKKKCFRKKTVTELESDWLWVFSLESFQWRKLYWGARGNERTHLTNRPSLEGPSRKKAHSAKALRLAQTSVIQRLERRPMCLGQRTKRSVVGDEVIVSEGPSPAVLYWAIEGCCLGVRAPSNKQTKQIF